MARIFGGNVDFYLDDTQIEDWLNSATITFDVPVGDITSFTDIYQNVVAGKKNATLEIAGALDTASAAADEVIFECIGAGVKTSKFEPGGGTPSASNPYYQCSASGLTGTFVKRYSISLPVGDAASFTASLQNSGSTTREIA